MIFDELGIYLFILIRKLIIIWKYGFEKRDYLSSLIQLFGFDIEFEMSITQYVSVNFTNFDNYLQRWQKVVRFSLRLEEF